MKIRNCAIAVAVAALTLGSVNQSKALPQESVPLATSSSAGTGVWLTGGFIGVVAVICAYDIYLKVSGAKNWDGSTKAVAKRRR